jgi:hypothetical protein
VTRPGVINPAGIRAAYLPLNDGSSILLGRSKIRPTGTTKGLDEKEMCERPAVKGPFVAENRCEWFRPRPTSGQVSGQYVHSIAQYISSQGMSPASSVCGRAGV